jgi:AcrR family transcriptional regulator
VPPGERGGRASRVVTLDRPTRADAHGNEGAEASVVVVSTTRPVVKSAVVPIQTAAPRGVSGWNQWRNTCIAKAAGADKKAIYLYFGDKRALFETVLATEFGSIADSAPMDPHDVGTYIRRLFDRQRAHPKHLRLMMWEALELGDGEIPGVVGRTAYCQARPQPIADAQQAGELDPNLNPAGLWLALAGMVNWTLGIGPMTRMTLGEGPEALDGQRELLVELARRILGQPHLAPVEAGWADDEADTADGLRSTTRSVEL